MTIVNRDPNYNCGLIQEISHNLSLFYIFQTFYTTVILIIKKGKPDSLMLNRIRITLKRNFHVLMWNTKPDVMTSLLFLYKGYLTSIRTSFYKIHITPSYFSDGV